MSTKLATTYLGIPIKHPIMPGASPMVDNLDTVRRLEDAGASAIVMHSLFEEQIEMDWAGAERFLYSYEDSNAEATTYFPQADEFALTPEKYLIQISKLKQTVDIPVIASLNGATPGGWVTLAESMQDAGADALELNLYTLPSDPSMDADAIENSALEILRGVRENLTIPVAVKLSPFYSSIASFVSKLEAVGADGAVLFNRFYQPDIDIETLEVRPSLQLSDPSELRLRLRWLALLDGVPNLDFAVSGGVHSASDVVKSIMAGASAVQMVSALLKNGPEYLARIIQDFDVWMNEHEYESVDQMRGSMSYSRCPNPSDYERANYVRVLQTWRA
jgi:dihydroorotate dehydrogenase (fumarate)